ncbi:MAG: hypothetical protein RLP02_39570 [Coleofasciculus sp. C2-GNP5-27]
MENSSPQPLPDKGFESPAGLDAIALRVRSTYRTPTQKSCDSCWVLLPPGFLTSFAIAFPKTFT